jgi:hypothetical protein
MEASDVDGAVDQGSWRGLPLRRHCGAGRGRPFPRWLDRAILVKRPNQERIRTRDGRSSVPGRVVATFVQELVRESLPTVLYCIDPRECRFRRGANADDARIRPTAGGVSRRRLPQALRIRNIRNM